MTHPGSDAAGQLGLERVDVALRAQPPKGPDDWAELAARLGMPAAQLRELVAFHPDLGRPVSEPRVCVGTSCFLRGGEAVARALPDFRRSHCLGHCDHSPAALDPTTEPRVGADLAEPARLRRPAPVSPRTWIRSAAAKPIVTRNLHADFGSLEAARGVGAYTALEEALRYSPAKVLASIEASGERGRGGAGFGTGAKWRAATPAETVIANGDEGDPGSFIDRLLLERDPHSVLEGLALCAFAVGAREGIVFVRSEYPRANSCVRSAVAEATAHGFLGDQILGSDFSFRVRVVSGFGSYVCGEETALLETLEGRKGEVRLRPPYPTEAGLFGRPTVVNNVETLATVPWILEHGDEAFRSLGTAASCGTKALCLSAGFGAPGVIEVEFGRSLRDVIEIDAKTEPDRLAAVILGGPMGSLLFPDEWDVPICYDALAQRGQRLGHGGLVAVPGDVDWNALLRHWLDFMTRESCGRCLPCREGSRWARDHVAAGDVRAGNLDETLHLIEQTSLCGFGQGAPGPIRSLLSRLGAAALKRSPGS